MYSCSIRGCSKEEAGREWGGGGVADVWGGEEEEDEEEKKVKEVVAICDEEGEEGDNQVRGGLGEEDTVWE